MLRLNECRTALTAHKVAISTHCQDSQSFNQSVFLTLRVL